MLVKIPGFRYTTFCGTPSANSSSFLLSCLWSIGYLKVGTIKFRTLTQLLTLNLRWSEHLNPLAMTISLSLRCREISPLNTHAFVIFGNFFPWIRNERQLFITTLVQTNEKFTQPMSTFTSRAVQWICIGKSCSWSCHNYVKHVLEVYFGLAVAWPWLLNAH